MSMKKKIILHGHLAEKYPHEIEVEAETIAEALSALTMIEELAPLPGHPWPVVIQGVDSEVALFAKTSLSEIHVYPQMEGAKKGGLGQIVLGVVLIAVSIWNPQFLAGAIQFMGGTGSLFLAGALMITGGILQMLMPTPQGMEEVEGSKYLGANQNTVKIGTRIPLAYGNNKIGGHYLSFDIDAVNWAGKEGDTGVSSIVGDNIFVEHDKTPVDLVPVSPVFASPIAGPTNIPTSAWITS